METCSGTQHWARMAKAHGHEVVLIPPRVVTPYRHGKKIDANDAQAIYEASPHKTVEQQALGVLDSVRAHYQSRKNKLSNAIQGIWPNLV